MKQPVQATDNLLPGLLRVALYLGEQKDVPRLLQVLLHEAKLLGRAHGGLVWLYDDSPGAPGLRCLQPPPETEPGGLLEAPWRLNLAQTDRLPVAGFLSGQPMLCDYRAADRQAADIELAEADGIRARTTLLLPLCNHEGTATGVLQLFNPRDHQGRDITAFVEEDWILLQSMVSYAGIALSNLNQVQELKSLLDAFIKVIAQAIDAKSPHTSAHCQRVPLLTKMLAQAACDDGDTFADFQLDDDGWYELHVAAWLHDCGKLATPDSVLDKATKLQTLHDRIDEVASRFASLRAEIRFAYEKKCWHDPQQEPAHRQTMSEEIHALTDDLAFLERINRGGEGMSAAEQQRVRRIAQRHWVDVRGQSQPLLSEDEVYNLCIPRGTLTPEERQVINGHMDVTLDMLESLPFPPKLRQVPEYAGGHHEKMDGSGFPRGLTREQMSIPARIMAIADVFEALTAKERPYKAPLKLSEALGILQHMRDINHLDPDLYQLFIRSGVWRHYAEQHLDPSQLDVTQGDAYL